MVFSEKIKKWLNKFRYWVKPEERTILLTCFGIALIFWLLVKLSQEFGASKQVVLSLEMPEDKALSALPPEDIKVQIRGSGWDLAFDYLKRNRVVLPIDLRNSRHFYLSEAQLRGMIAESIGSSDLRVITLNISGITFDLQDKVVKKVPLRLQSRIRFAEGHQLVGNLTLSPDSVRLTGPAESIASYNNWTTDSLKLDNLNAGFTREIRLTRPPNIIILDPLKVSVTAQVERVTEKTIFVPVKIINTPADSLKVFPDMVQVSFTVGLSRFQEVTHEDFDLVADLKDFRFRAGKNTAPLALTRQPADIKNVNINKRSVEFLIVK